MLLQGVDAIARVLKRAKKEGLKSFGHSYKKSIEGMHIRSFRMSLYREYVPQRSSKPPEFYLAYNCCMSALSKLWASSCDPVGSTPYRQIPSHFLPIAHARFRIIIRMIYRVKITVKGIERGNNYRYIGQAERTLHKHTNIQQFSPHSHLGLHHA
jgi:hypothetical protein